MESQPRETKAKKSPIRPKTSRRGQLDNLEVIGDGNESSFRMK